MKLSQEMEEDLKGRLKGECSAKMVTRSLYSTDASMFKLLPALVVAPFNTRDVVEVVRYARRHNIPVAARGAGTGLAGESLSNGIVLDFSVHMNGIRELQLDKNEVTLEPGVVHGVLNQQLKKHGKIFGPDPATSNRCTLGGMIANNSTGAHSLKYGMTNSWIKALKVVTFDGEIVELKKGELPKKFESLRSLFENNHHLIEKTWPRTPRNRHGYRLKGVYENGTWDLTQLFCGHEGTLGIVVEATLCFCDLPTKSDLIYLSFQNTFDAAKATPLILKYSPSAVEIIDDVCLGMAREEKVYKEIFGGDIGALLLVELDGDSTVEIEKKIESIVKETQTLAITVGYGLNEKMRETIWTMRKHIAGMINKVPGKYQPVPVVEDVCVHPDVLHDYFIEVDKVFKKYDLKYLSFGHAGGGTVHIRPFINLKEGKTYKWLPDMSREIYEITLKLKGTISGEHGDGYLRAPFIKMQYGELYDVFLEIKKIFDPDNIFNPDKKTGCPDFLPWSEYLKFGGEYSIKPKDYLLKWKGNSLFEITEACNGCGVCRSNLKDTDMCPVFKAENVEASSTRAKANLMRSFFTGELDLEYKKDLLDVAKFCINCKMCSLDCPSHVSAGDLMTEMKAQVAKDMGHDLAEKVLFMSESLFQIGSLFPRTFNFFMGLSTPLMELLTGLSSKRVPPKLANSTFLKKNRSVSPEKPVDKVVYFVDLYANHFNPNIAESFLKIMEKNSVEVVIPTQKACGIVELNYGNVEGARRNSSYNMAELKPYLDKGYKVICTEPTAALMLTKEYAYLHGDDEVKTLSENTYDVTSYLIRLFEKKLLNTEFRSYPKTVGYHMPCHLKAILKDKNPPIFKILDLIPDLDYVFINEGCCGIAGTFGTKKSGYETSMKIGNDLFNALKSDNINYGLTECSTCKMQMEHGSAKKVLHPVEVIAEAYST